MSETPPALSRQPGTREPRPLGRVQPDDPTAARAVRAIAEQRLRDADAHIARLPDWPAEALAWKHLLKARAALLRHDWADGAREALAAAGAGRLIGSEPSSRAGRIIADALNVLGECRRREESLPAAEAAHRAAYELDRQSGSELECAESAAAVGSTLLLRGDMDGALEWHELSLDHARAEPECADGRSIQRDCRARVRVAMLAAGRFAQAVQVARDALARARSLDPGAIDSAEALSHLGEALLDHGQQEHESRPTAARGTIAEAAATLAAAAHELRAFGGSHQETAQACEDRADFARRLLESLGESEPVAS